MPLDFCTRVEMRLDSEAELRIGWIGGRGGYMDGLE